MARPRRERRWGFWIFLLLLGGSLGVYVITRPEPKIEVKVVVLGRGAVEEVISPISSGEILPRARATIHAEITGTIKEIHKREGEHVKAGEVILLLGAEDLKARKSQAEAGVLTARSALKQAKLRAEAAKQNRDRAQKLAREGALTQSELERAEAEYAVAAEAIEAARAQRKLSESSVKLAKDILAKAKITAPFDGVLSDPPSSSALSLAGASAFTPTTSRLEVGAQVTLGTPLFEVVDTSSLHIEAAFDELDAGRLKIGEKAVLTFDALPDVKIEGVIESLDPIFTRDAKGGRMRVVNISLPEDDRLVAGMSADVEIVIDRREHVLALPSHLIAGRGVKRTVWVVEAGRAKQRQVEVGLSGWSESEVIQGLSEGEQVISSLDIEGLEEGVLLEISLEDEKKEP